MNLIYLSLKNLQNKPLSTFLSILLLTMGVGIISGVLILGNRLEEKFQKNIEGINMVVGAKGSPLQLILSSVYHIDNPTGNISLAEADSLAKHPLIKSVIRLGYGDSYKGFRIVGTSHKYPEHYGVHVKNGKLWQKSYEATIGYQIAKKLNLKIGDTFAGAHGLVEGGKEHTDHSYQVVGIFESSGTVIDQLILTDIETVWNVHHHEEGDEENHKDEHDHDKHEEVHHEETETKEVKNEGHHHHEEGHEENHKDEHDHGKHEEVHHEETETKKVKDEGHHHHEEGHEENHKDEREHAHDDHEKYLENNHEIHEDHTESPKEITAMLVKFRSMMAMMNLPRFVNEETSMQAALPSIEINRLYGLMGVGKDTLRMIALAIIFVSGISVFVSLFNSLKNRQYELALMRTLGASQLQLFLLIIGEGLILSLIGFIGGMILSRIGLFFISQNMQEQYHYDLQVWTFLPEEWALFGITILIGLIASLIPAIQAFRTEISKTLAEN